MELEVGAEREQKSGSARAEEREKRRTREEALKKQAAQQTRISTSAFHGFVESIPLDELATQPALRRK